MKKFLNTLLGLIIIVGILAWVFVFFFGGFEILWWIFTGNFFHFF